MEIALSSLKNRTIRGSSTEINSHCIKSQLKAEMQKLTIITPVSEPMPWVSRCLVANKPTKFEYL